MDRSGIVLKRKVKISKMILLALLITVGSALVATSAFADNTVAERNKGTVERKKTIKERFKNSEKITPEVEESIEKNLTEEQIDFYVYVQDLKDKNPNLSPEELVKLIDWSKIENANKKAMELKKK